MLRTLVLGSMLVATGSAFSQGQGSAAVADRSASSGKEGAPIRVSGGVMQGLLVTKVNPTYPPDAKAKGVSGAVVLAATISKEGIVQKVSVVSGPEDLRDVALEAVRQWVYRPYLLNGKAVRVQTTVTVNFSLGG